MALKPIDFLAASLNEDKKITAKFNCYTIENSDDNEILIKAVLDAGDTPLFQEGFQSVGKDLLISLCDLYILIKDIDVQLQASAVITWCKENIHPYEIDKANFSSYDFSHVNDFKFWEAVVDFDGFTFKLTDFINDLKQLYTINHIVTNFNHILNKSNHEEKEIKWLEDGMSQAFVGLQSLSQIQQLHIIERFLDAHYPKFNFSFTVDSLGELQIMPAFKSVFDVAYYMMARAFVPEPETEDTYNLRNLYYGICEYCGRLFEKNSNRQKFCNNYECQKERNRRKSKRAYQKKCSK